MKGPNFIALHELFDRVAELAEGYVDTVAERIAALGGRAEGTISMVGQRTKLAAYPLQIVDGRDHVDAVSTALATVAKRYAARLTKPLNSVMPTRQTCLPKFQGTSTSISGSWNHTCKGIG